MADSGPWDDSDRHESSGRHQRRPLWVSHLGRSPRQRGTSSRSKVDHDADGELQDMTSSLRASSEVLSTADRMLDHYRSINEDQDEEIRRVSHQCLGA